MAWEMKLVEKEGLSGPVLEVVAGLNQTSFEYMNKPGTWKHFQDITSTTPLRFYCSSGIG